MNQARSLYILQLITISLLPFLMVLGNSMFIPLIPNIQNEFNITAVQSGMMLTMFTIPAAIIIPFIGILSDRFGRKSLVTICLMILSIGSIVSMIATLLPEERSWEILLIGRVFQGIGAGGTTLAMAIVADMFTGSDLSQGLGALEVFNGVAKVISPMIGGMIAMLAWNYSFYVYLFLTVITMILFTFVMKDQRTLKNKQSLYEYLKKLFIVLKSGYKWLIPIFLCSGVGLFSLFGTLFFLSMELEQIYGIQGLQKGIYLAAPLCGLTIFSFLSGKKVGTEINQLKRFMLIGLFFYFVAYCCLIYFHDYVSLLFYSTIASSGLGLFLPAASTAITTSVSTYERGGIVALYNTVRFLGVAFGPIFFAAWMYDLQEMFMKTTFFIGVTSGLLMLSWNCIPLFHKCSTS